MGEKERELMEVHQLDEDDYDRICDQLMPLIKEFGTEAMAAVHAHLVETVAVWID